jgi:hypothetical protein
MSDLVEDLVCKGVIPADIKGDHTLYLLLIEQMKRQVVENLSLPPFKLLLPQFAYTAFTKQSVLLGVSQEVEKLRETLERETGVDIYHYHRLSSVSKKEKI